MTWFDSKSNEMVNARRDQHGEKIVTCYCHIKIVIMYLYKIKKAHLKAIHKKYIYNNNNRWQVDHFRDECDKVSNKIYEIFSTLT